MTALYIVGGILLFVFLLLLLRIGVMLVCYGKAPQLVIRIGPVPITLDLKEIGKEAEKQAEKPTKDKKKQKKTKKEEKSAKKSVTEIINTVKDGAERFIRKYKRYARLDRYMLKINLGTDDPAKTALLYGGVSAAAGALHVLAMSVRKKRGEYTVETEIRPDFLAEKTDIAIEIGFSLRVWQWLSCLWTAWRTKKKVDKLPPKTEEEGEQKDDR